MGKTSGTGKTKYEAKPVSEKVHRMVRNVKSGSTVRSTEKYYRGLKDPSGKRGRCRGIYQGTEKSYYGRNQVG